MRATVTIPFCVHTIALSMFHCVSLDRGDYPRSGVF